MSASLRFFGNSPGQPKRELQLPGFIRRILQADDAADRVGLLKARHIQNVEEIRVETQGAALVNRYVLEQGDIETYGTRARPELVAPGMEVRIEQRAL